MGGEAEGCSLHHHRNSPHSAWNKFNRSPGKKNPPGLHPARRYMDAAAKWQQPLGEPGAPALEAAVDFEGEGEAPNFCQPQLRTQSRIYQGLLHKSLENTSTSAKSPAATAAFQVQLLLSGVQITLSLGLQNHIQTFSLPEIPKRNKCW